MLPILEFIFSSFWVWAGTVILVSIVAAAVSGIRLVSWSHVIHPERKLLRQLIRDEIDDKMPKGMIEYFEKIACLVEAGSRQGKSTEEEDNSDS